MRKLLTDKVLAYKLIVLERGKKCQGFPVTYTDNERGEKLPAKGRVCRNRKDETGSNL